jgi:hypothetical protein
VVELREDYVEFGGMETNRVRILFKSLLKDYYVPVPSDFVDSFKKKCSGLGTYFFFDTPENLRKMGACYLFLYAHSVANTQIISYDLVERWVQVGEYSDTDSSIRYFESKVLVIYHPSVTVQNSQLRALILQVVSERFHQGKCTLLLSETDDQDLRKGVQAIISGCSFSLPESRKRNTQQAPIRDIPKKNDQPWKPNPMLSDGDLSGLK